MHLRQNMCGHSPTREFDQVDCTEKGELVIIHIQPNGLHKFSLANNGHGMSNVKRKKPGRHQRLESKAQIYTPPPHGVNVGTHVDSVGVSASLYSNHIVYTKKLNHSKI